MARLGGRLRHLGGRMVAYVFLVAAAIFFAVQAVRAERLRIDQTVGLWWRYGTLLVLAQWLVTIVAQGIVL